MNNRLIISALCLILTLGVASHSNLEDVSASSLTGRHTLVLYDAASGGIPSSPAMNFIDFPAGAASSTYLDGGTVLDTTESGNTYAGWISSGTSIAGFPILDRTIGFQVDFTIQVEEESHQNNNRAGFSIIVLSDDAMGVELAFWENEIWVQSDENTGGLFKHGEGINFATTTALTDYQVFIFEDTYTLTANAQPILTGLVRDYSGFEGFPDPYETPNFLFLGDDTTSAQARIRLRFVSVTGSEPVMPTSTGSHLPLDSPTVLPNITPSPVQTSTPSPPPNFYEFCPINFSMVILLSILKLSSPKKDFWKNKK